jgi:hypothetical protein
MFKKHGEAMEIGPHSIQSYSSVPDIDPAVLEEMKKYATTLKRIAPKAEDFLYFSAVMMHAAEAVLINADGSPRLTRTGEPLKAQWEISSNGSWKWICNDPFVKAFKNSNGDIFPEAQLIQAYKKWVGKPLCIDHKSNSVDHVRGFIVDTYYDRNLKRVVALCALDRVNYPDLARKIETGYSNSVSMGVGVERAVCFDCGTVARCEADFCHHMRTKSGYGEINTGLNPIELSIVVNGADPDARIKHIIATTDTLNAYVEEKQQQFSKLAGQYEASLSLKDGSKTVNLSFNASDLSEFEQSIKKAIDDYSKLTSMVGSLAETNASQDRNNAAYSQTDSTVSMPETELPNTDFSLAPPNARLAMTSDELTNLTDKLSSIEARIAKMQSDFTAARGQTRGNGQDKQANNQNEDTMAETKGNVKQGYFQGGGGLNEPTPGQRKYDIDPISEDMRDHGDKQMVGQKPFPDVGNVNEIYPGYESFPTGELERKKMLARAESEERVLRRSGAIQKVKQGYFQNGETDKNPNTPTPHKRKYDVDPLDGQDRNQHDKQMVGQKPFPDVGDVEGLHQSPLSADEKDELKRKEKLRRAGLTARFTKSSDAASSTWEVFGADEQTILTKTVDELTNGRANELGAAVGTEAFGKDLMSKIRTLGVEKVDALFSKAQVPPPAPMGDAPALPPAVPMDGASGKDLGGDGDQKGSVVELAEKVRDTASDLAEKIHELAPDLKEAGDSLEGAPMAAHDSGSSDSCSATASLETDIVNELKTKIAESVDVLGKHEAELRAVVRLYDTNAITAANKGFLVPEIDATIADAKKAFAEAHELMLGFTRFADAVDMIDKRATGDETMANKEIMGMLGETDAGLQEIATAFEDELTATAKDESSDESDSSSADDLVALVDDDLSASDSDSECSSDESSADDNEAIMVADVPTAVEVAKVDPGVSVEVKKATLEDRIALRSKIASEMDKVMEIFYDFHPNGGQTPSASVKEELKSQHELAHVEDLEERHEKMMEVVHTTPKVKQAAADIQAAIKSGSITPDQVDQLAAHGVDSEAIKYWKEFYGEMGSEGKTFAADLVKEHAKAQFDAEIEKHKVKLARSYDLAYQMRDAQMISSGRDAVKTAVDEIMLMNDHGYEKVKQLVAQHTPVLAKRASMPQVSGMPLFSEESSPIQDLRTQLDAAFSTSKPRLF